MARDFDDPFEEERAFTRYGAGRRASIGRVAPPIPSVAVRLATPNAIHGAPTQEDDGAAVEPVAARQAPAPEAALSWIEVVLEDAEGNPRANEAYLIKLPDGSIRQGKLGSDGQIRLDPIPAGDCEINFPDL